MRIISKTGSNHFKVLTFLLLVFAASAAFGQIPKPTEKGNVITYPVTDARYCEFFLLEDSGGQLSANVYNTIGLNICPEDQVKETGRPSDSQRVQSQGVPPQWPALFCL